MGNIIKPKKYRAKSKKTGNIIEGWYFNFPDKIQCFANRGEKIIHCLIWSGTMDWNMPPYIDYEEIDIDTLEEIDDVTLNEYRLKPCPFCGGEGYLAYSSFNDSCDIVATIVCKNCGAEAEGFEYQEFDEKGWNEAKIKARQAWNRRI